MGKHGGKHGDRETWGQTGRTPFLYTVEADEKRVQVLVSPLLWWFARDFDLQLGAYFIQRRFQAFRHIVTVAVVRPYRN
jgi:hypothetical protein